MQKNFLKVLSMLLAIFFLTQNAFAEVDPNVDGGGGGLGQGTSDNSWSISSESGGIIYDADGLRVYLVNSSTGVPVSSSIDITNYNIAEDDVINYRGKTKYEYNYINNTLDYNIAYQKVRINTSQTAQLPRIISNYIDADVAAATSAVRIEAVKNWFKNINYYEWVIGQLGYNLGDMQANGYKLAIEPIAYFRYQGYNYAITATEAALFDQLAGGNLTSKMGPLTRQNLPLAIFLEEDEFTASSYRINAWTGTTNSYVGNTDIVNQLGIGYINYFSEREETEGEATFSYPTDTWVVTPFRLCNVRNIGGSWVNGYPITSRNPSSATITINGTAYNISNIYVPSGNEQLIWVKWKTPSTPQTVTAYATCTKGYLYNNQNTGISDRYVTSVTANITVYSNNMENTPPDPTLDDTASSMRYNSSIVVSNKNNKLSSSTATNSWVVWDCNFQLERTYTQTYSATNSYPSYPTGNTYDEPTGIYTERSVINSYSSRYGYWIGEYYYSYTVYYVTVEFKEYKYRYNRINYTAEVRTTNTRITPDSHCPTAYTQNNKTYMKSGYGINIEAEPYIRITIYYEKTGQTTTDTYYSASSTNYAASPQYVFAYFPEFMYSTYNRQLEFYSNKYVFKKNKYSTYNDRTHYTPWWFPDSTNYEIVTRSDFAYTPAGKLNLYGVSNSIVIEGNLMDDWRQSPVR